MFGMPGHWEILIIVFVILLVFGGKKIPELARCLGKGIREFKDGMQQVDDEVKKELDDTKQKSEEKSEK